MEQHTVLANSAISHATKVSTPGLGTEQVVELYDDWSKDSKYDKELGDPYRGPAVAATAVCYHLQCRTDVSVLDVAAGTGKVGIELKKHGLNQVDALEPSKGMLDVAKSKNIYRNYFNIYLTSNVPTLQSNSYDALVCCGGMMDGHLMCNVLPEMVRIVKLDGLIVIVMREEYLQTVAEYKDKLEPYMKQLETDGHWVLVDRTVIPGFFYHFNGVRFVFKVSKTENGSQSGYEEGK